MILCWKHHLGQLPAESPSFVNCSKPWILLQPGHHKRLGLIDKSQVEREYHTDKAYCLLFWNMKNWIKMHDAIQWATLLHKSSSFRSSRHIVGVIWLKADALRSIAVATEEKKAFKRQVVEEKRGPTSSAAIRKKVDWLGPFLPTRRRCDQLWYFCVN